MIGFTFRNQHSDDFNVVAKSVDRSLIPELRKNEFAVPGRHGTVDYGLNTYEKRQIRVEIGLIRNATFENLRQSARDIAKWLSGKGILIFDDEPDKAYDASVYDYVGIDQTLGHPSGLTSITFECQPFAESLAYNQVNLDVTENNKEISVTVAGTADAGCIITIKNTGATSISGITIRRKVAI